MLRTQKLTKRRLRKLLISLLVVLALALVSKYDTKLSNNSGASIDGTYSVTQVFDGDTIEVNMNGNLEKIRFIGVDTPETHDPRKAVQCFGRAASDFTKNLLESKRVRLEADPLSTNRDRYDRLLRYIYLDQTLVNAEIIRSGYGFAYIGFEFTKSEDFKKYQQEARAENRGLWAGCNPVENEFGGFTSNDAE